MFNIKEELDRVPLKPGVYIMHDQDDGVLYVGKAKILRNRLRSYFMNIPHSDRITMMISRIARFEYIVCSSEYEALMLENNLIKKHKPKYNVMLRDDKGYPYIKVTTTERFPRVVLAHQKIKDGSTYFGPYFSSWTAKGTLETIKDIIPLRPCQKKITAKTHDRPCLNYHMGLCGGACAGLVDEAEYQKQVEAVIDFLNGHNEYAEKMINDAMMKASAEREYERAAVYRERLRALEKMREKQKIALMSEDDFDAVAVAHNKVDAMTQVFFVRGGKVVGRESFLMDGLADEPESVLLESFLTQFYNGTQYIPPRIYVGTFDNSGDQYDEFESGLEAMSMHFTELRTKKCEIIIPKRGDKLKMCLLARENAEITLKNRETSMITGAGSERELRMLGILREIFDLPTSPMRIESYDISNLGSSDINASMVVFEQGKPLKSDYRLFKMKTIKAASDTDSMFETITRRMTHLINGDKGFDQKPDLLMIDGGLTQINAVRAALAKLDETADNSAQNFTKLTDIPVIGMVKDNHHKSRALLGPTEAGKKIPYGEALAFGDVFEYDLRSDPEIWRFVTAVQDEVHRVAVSYNRKISGKRNLRSGLDGIPGVGDKRKMALIAKFRTFGGIKDATEAELSDTPGIGKDAAHKIYVALHPEEQ